MKLYFIPFACSLATRIAANEAGLEAEYVQVGSGGTLPDGRSFGEVSPMGYVPAIEMDEGHVLTEGPAVLQYLADRTPEGVLAPGAGTAARYETQRWLNFVSTELHKAVFVPLLGRDVADAVRAYALARAARPLGVLDRHLEGRETLHGDWSIADAYLFTVLNWSEFAGMDLAPYPHVRAYRSLQRRRPSVAAAMATEAPLREAA